MLKTALLALVGLTLVACSSSEEPAPQPAPVADRGSCPAGSTYEVRLSPGLPFIWQVGTVDALSVWSEALQGQWKVTMGVSDQVEDLPVTGCVINVWPGGAPKTAWGSTYKLPEEFGVRPDRATIYVSLDREGLDRDAALATMIHELGHVLGLDHDRDRTHLSVMWPFVTVTDGKIGCTDQVAACKVWGCAPTCSGERWLE